MTPVWRLLRRDLQSRRRALLALALLLGLVGGAVLASAAGARRTDTAYHRLRAWARASQVQIILDHQGRYAAALRRLSGVQSVAVTNYVSAVLPAGHGSQAVTALSSPDNTYGVRTDAVKILAGHMWQPQDPHAVMVDEQIAEAEHLRPGSSFRLTVIPRDPATGNEEPGLAATLRLTVSAVVVFDFQVAPATAANADPAVLLSPPFARSALASKASYGIELSLQLRPGASSSAVLRRATALAARDKTIGTGNFNDVDLTDQINASQQAIRPQGVALAAFAVLAGLILLAVTGQLLSRQLVLDAVDFPALRALGMSPRQLLALMLAKVITVTLAGGLLAVIVAVVVSPLTPIGPARLAEPSPGAAANLAILGPGLGLAVIAPLALALPVAWRIASRPAGSAYAQTASTPDQPNRLIAALGGRSSATWGMGLRMAFQAGRGRSAVPVRSAQLGTVVAVAATVASLVFSASFLHLLSSPAQYGQNWQQELNLGFGGISAQAVTKLAAMQPGLQDYAAGDYGEVSVNDRIVPAVGIDAFRGSGFVTMLSGRAPATDDEIALGAQTMQALHLRPGQWAQVGVTGQAGFGQRASTRHMKIVGTAVLPAFGQGTIIDTDLGSGAVLRAAALSVPFKQTGCTATCYNFILGRYGLRTSMRTAAANLVATTHKIGCPPQACQVTADQQPTDIRNYASVRQTPLVLGLVLALLAIGTLAHVLLTSVRRRARDLAMLKVLGMGRAQVLCVVLWQALAFSIVAVAVGLPLGSLAGRWAWLLFARSAGVPGDPVVPVLVLAAFIPATLLLACLVAAIPGQTAGRLTPAAVLRAQ